MHAYVSKALIHPARINMDDRAVLLQNGYPVFAEYIVLLSANTELSMSLEL